MLEKFSKYRNGYIDNFEIDWSNKRIIKNTLAKGTVYCVYCNDKFYGWLTRKEINEIKRKII